MQALRVAGASHLQGYFFSRPVDAERACEIAEAGYLADDGEDQDGPELPSTAAVRG